MSETVSEPDTTGLGPACGCYLTAEEIQALGENDKPAIEGSLIKCYENWSYNLRLGPEVYLSSEKLLTKLSGKQDSIVIQPGEFALLTTLETLNIPLDHVAFISLRFRYALKGLINISGFHVDPGFQGKLVFSVYNAGPNPVVMRYQDEVFMIIFAHLDKAVKAREHPEFDKIDRLKSEWISAVKGPAVSLTKLNRQVERLSTRVNVLITILVAVLATAIGLILLGVHA